MWDALIGAFLFGLVGGSVPGPFLTCVFTEILHVGFAKTLRVILWGLIAETSVIVLLLLIAYLIDPPRSVFYAISFAGACFLFYLAWTVSRVKKMDGERRTFFTLKKIFAVSFLNGPLYLFWATVGIPLAFELKDVPYGIVWFLLVFELGWVSATTVWAFLFSRFRRILTQPHFIPRIFMAMALILCFFAIRMIVQGIKFFAG